MCQPSDSMDFSANSLSAFQLSPSFNNFTKVAEWAAGISAILLPESKTPPAFYLLPHPVGASRRLAQTLGILARRICELPRRKNRKET